MESKKYNKLVNETKKQQTHRYRTQVSGYQWGEGWVKGQYRDVKKIKGLLWDLMKSCVWNFWKLLSAIRFEETFIQLKQLNKIRMIVPENKKKNGIIF